MVYRQCFQHLYDIERKRIVTPANVSMRLNRGERPMPLPEEIRRTLRSALKLNQLQQYPDYKPFYEKLSKYIGFPTHQIVVGAGIEEFIRTLMFLCCDPGDKALVLWPTCAMYDIYAAAFGVDLIRVKPVPGKRLSVDELLFAIHDDVRVVFLPNPGQPVETCFSTFEILALAEYCKKRDILLAVDEWCYGFGAPEALPLVRTHDNVLVMRTFSKFFSGAALRVGFVVGQERVVKPLHAVRPSGEISGPSLTMASVLLDHLDVLEQSARDTIEARDWLRDTINTSPTFASTSLLPSKAYGEHGFSVLIKFDSELACEAMNVQLEKQGIYVKANFPPPVEGCMLVACGDLDYMRSFYRGLVAACFHCSRHLLEIVDG